MVRSAKEKEARRRPKGEKAAPPVPRPPWVAALLVLSKLMAMFILLTHTELFSVYKGHSPKSGRVGISAVPAMIEGLYRVDILRRYRKARGLVDDTARALHLPRELFRGVMASAGLQHYALSRAELKEYADAEKRLEEARKRRKASDDAEFRRTGIKRKKSRRSP